MRHYRARGNLPNGLAESGELEIISCVEIIMSLDVTLKASPKMSSSLDLLVPVVNVLTHAPAVYYLLEIKSWSTSHYLVLFSLVSSCLMHVSETKHQLPGIFSPTCLTSS